MTSALAERSGTERDDGFAPKGVPAVTSYSVFTTVGGDIVRFVLVLGRLRNPKLGNHRERSTSRSPARARCIALVRPIERVNMLQAHLCRLRHSLAVTVLRLPYTNWDHGWDLVPARLQSETPVSYLKYQTYHRKRMHNYYRSNIVMEIILKLFRLIVQ